MDGHDLSEEDCPHLFLVDYSLDDISPWFPAGLMLDLEKLLNHKVDVATEAALKDQIRERVLSEAIAL